MKDKLSGVSQITSIAGFALSVIISIIYGVIYMKNELSFLERRISIQETNYGHVYPAIDKINLDMDKLKDNVEKIFIIVSKDKKDAVFPS